MKRIAYLCCLPLLLGCGWFFPACADSFSVTTPVTEFVVSPEPLVPLFAAPRWWDETVSWIRSIGWDRGRLVQLWLFFMLVGLYIIVRIKPRG
jgi:hypothetical protein